MKKRRRGNRDRGSTRKLGGPYSPFKPIPPIPDDPLVETAKQAVIEPIMMLAPPMPALPTHLLGRPLLLPMIASPSSTAYPPPPPPLLSVPPAAEIRLKLAALKAKAGGTTPSIKAVAHGIAGAAMGDAVDKAFGTSSIGSLMLGGLGKLLAIHLKTSDPEAAATIDSMANGAMIAGAVKAASKMKPEIEPLEEEAKKAVEEMEKT